MIFPGLSVEVAFGDAPNSPYLRFDNSTSGKFDTAQFAPDFVGTDVSADARSIRITRGRQRLLEATSAGTCEVLLNNRHGNYTPGWSGGAFIEGGSGTSYVVPMIRMRVRAVWNGVWYPEFTGFTDAWELNYPGMGKDATTTLRASDAFKVLARHEPGTSSDPSGEGELSSARIGRLLDSASWPAQDRDIDTGTLTVSATSLEANTLSEMNDVTLSEGGNLYVSVDGKVTFRNRHARIEHPRSTSVQATFKDDGSGLRYAGIRPAADDDLIKNSITGTRAGGAPQSWADSVSVGHFGIRSYNVTNLWHTDDADVANWVSWIGSLFSQYEDRVEDLTVLPQRDPSLWPIVLGTEFGDLFSVSRSVPGGTVTKYVFVEGIQHDIDLGGMRSWRTTFRFSSATGIYTPGATYLVFDNATSGKFDTGAFAAF